jgi:FlaA1/EpsC-like NDP-sugar epimerase
MPSARSLPLINGHDDVNVMTPISHKSPADITSTTAADACLDWVVFPTLLFIQFGATMHCQMKEGVLDMDWKTVHSTIFLFCIVAGVYRQILRRYSESIVLLLLPEIFTNILLALIMFGEMKTAYLVLVFLTLILFSIGAILANCGREDERPTDYQRLQGEEEEDTDEAWIC